MFNFHMDGGFCFYFCCQSSFLLHWVKALTYAISTSRNLLEIFFFCPLLNEWNIFVIVPLALGKKMASQSEGHRVWYVNFVIPLIITLRVFMLLFMNPSFRELCDSFATVFHYYCVSFKFSLCSWVQLRVDDASLGADVYNSLHAVIYKEIQIKKVAWQRRGSTFRGTLSSTLVWDLLLREHLNATCILAVGHGQHVIRFSRFHFFGQPV